MFVMKKLLKKKILNQSGFTLLEALISATILAFGILSVFNLLVSSIRNNTQAMAVTEAATIAADKMEYLNALPGWADGNPHDDLDADSDHQENREDGYTVAWDVEDKDIIGTIPQRKKITVTVTDGRLGNFGAGKEVQLISIKGRDL